MKNKGFTLIELLVVIAIIGVLATIVLASLGAARTRTNDAAVLSSMSSYRTQAELDYPTGNYTGLCSSSGYNEIEQYVQSRGGAIQECDENTTNYRVIALLPSLTASAIAETAFAAGENGVCINSLGTSQKVTLSGDSEAGYSLGLVSPACNNQDLLEGTYTYVCGEPQCYRTDVTPQQPVADSYCDAAGFTTSPCGI